ncbi:GNAT family N-acetyltransferase [Methylobacterium sp. NEAU 140]|uniref:GNAT family N-acetyltransferase n=1 Tax=Methylobacterium sp. NEAU 140 TaxID=3064945 RepID=UPI0027365074|nr:GNAT family N-acetyltransferase [Methylobacterium sp. NEAU 140]MDP4026537.1 GNAT family N-acetyltransferase [Methylobacterium sp. NEAU 140]
MAVEAVYGQPIGSRVPVMLSRMATAADEALIAQIQTTSWRSAYRDILHPDYLSDQIEEDRITFWAERLRRKSSGELIIIVVFDGDPVGFVCAVGDEEERWGTLVDNLHVLPECKGRGLGALLLKSAARWSLKRYPGAGLYLWCFEENLPARRFYARMGGVVVERVMHEPPGGGAFPALRFHWADPASV